MGTVLGIVVVGVTGVVASTTKAWIPAPSVYCPPALQLPTEEHEIEFTWALFCVLSDAATSWAVPQVLVAEAGPTARIPIVEKKRIDNVVMPLPSELRTIISTP